MEEKVVARFYDEVSTLYDAPDDLLDEHMYKEYEKEIKSFNFANKIILDIGTGTGWPALQISRSKGTRVVGIDISPGMIRIARIKQKRINAKNVDFVIASAENIPLRSNIFGTVICLGGVLNHMVYFNKAIHSINQVIIKYGTFIFEFDNWKSFETLWRICGFYGIKEQKNTIIELLRDGRVKKLQFPYIDTEGLKWITNYYFDRNFVEKVLHKNGFKIVKVRGVHVLIPILPPPIIRKTGKLLSLYLKIIGRFEEKFSRHPSFANLGVSIIVVAKAMKQK